MSCALTLHTEPLEITFVCIFSFKVRDEIKAHGCKAAFKKYDHYSVKVKCRIIFWNSACYDIRSSLDNVKKINLLKDHVQPSFFIGVPERGRWFKSRGSGYDCRVTEWTEHDASGSDWDALRREWCQR